MARLIAVSLSCLAALAGAFPAAAAAATFRVVDQDGRPQFASVQEKWWTDANGVATAPQGTLYPGVILADRYFTAETYTSPLAGSLTLNFDFQANPEAQLAEYTMVLPTMIKPSWDPGYNPDEQELIALVQAHRASMGLGSLQVNAALNRAADWYAKYLYDAGGVLDHFAVGSPTQRANAEMFGTKGGMGENIAKGYGSVAATMNGWLNSPGHRANIEHPSYKVTGIGVYRDLWVQMFSIQACPFRCEPPPTSTVRAYTGDSPVDPVAPVGPVAPVAPVTAVTPVTPVDPGGFVTLSENYLSVESRNPALVQVTVTRSGKAVFSAKVSAGETKLRLPGSKYRVCAQQPPSGKWSGFEECWTVKFTSTPRISVAISKSRPGKLKLTVTSDTHLTGITGTLVVTGLNGTCSAQWGCSRLKSAGKSSTIKLKLKGGKQTLTVTAPRAGARLRVRITAKPAKGSDLTMYPAVAEKVIVR